MTWEFSASAIAQIVAAGVMLAVISDILDFSKIEAGHLELESHPFALRPLIEESLDVLSLQAATKGIELLYRIDPAVPPIVQGDTARLRQVLINLLGNAVKFTERGQVVMDARLETPADGVAEPDCVRVRFAVADSGVGIPPEKIERLFKPFGQLDASITRRYGGTGLGLVICQRLVELMGGRIWAESSGAPDEGSVFHFVVRLGLVAGEARSSEVDTAHAMAGRRVLVAAGNAALRDYVKDLINAAGADTVRICATARELLALAKDGARWDAHIVDRGIVDSDPIATEAYLRQCAGDGIAVILLAPPGRYAGDGESSPFAAVLSKPVKPGQLLATLRRMIGAGDTQPAGVAPDTSSSVSRHLRILLAEDNPINQKITLAMLGKLGHPAEAVDIARDGHAAVQAVQRATYDVILMDVHMPDMDGLAATRAIRTQPPDAQQPYIIALTAATLQEDVEQCQSAGMDAYVSKPVRLENLADALARVPEATASRSQR